MDRVALEMRVVLLLLDAFCDGLLVTRREVAGYWLTFSLGFGTFESDYFAWHGV